MVAVAHRTCPSCGADVSSGATAFCPRCGADLEAKLIELGAPAPERARRAPRERRPKRARLLAGVAAVVVGGLAVTTLVGDDGEGRDDGDSNERDVAGPTTTTLADLSDRAPLLGEETGLAVVIRGQSRVLVDLDEGSIDEVGPFDPSSASDDAFVSTSELGVQLWEAPFDEPSARILDELGATDALVGSTVVWAFVLGEARALRRDESGVVVELALPSGAEPVGTLGDTLVVGAPGGTFAVGIDGTAELLASGTPLATGHDLLAVARCDAELACTVETLDTGGTVRQTVPLVGDGRVTAASVGPDGQVAWISSGPGGGYVHVDGRERFPLPSAGAATLDWSPDGRWLVGSFGRDDLWVLDAQAGPDAAPTAIDLGRNVYPEEVFVVAR
jgi:hypothetical protein